MNKEQINMRNQGRTKEILQVTWVGLWVNVALSISKISMGFFANSAAVVADGVHSLSDLITDFAIIFGAKVWASPADENHHYGHQRLESFVSLIIGVVLGFAGLGIAYDALLSLGKPRLESVGSILTLVILVCGIIGKEILFRWTRQKAIKLKSSAVEANAWDHRSDAISSIPVALAVGISMWKPEFAALDLVGAIVVGGFILYAAWNICVPAVNTLLDKGADQQTHEKILYFVQGLPEVKGAHRLRSRFLGQALSIDLHVQVDGKMSIEEANKVAHAVEDAFYGEDATASIGFEICDALIHIDPWVEKE